MRKICVDLQGLLSYLMLFNVFKILCSYVLAYQYKYFPPQPVMFIIYKIYINIIMLLVIKNYAKPGPNIFFQCCIPMQTTYIRSTSVINC